MTVALVRRIFMMSWKYFYQIFYLSDPSVTEVEMKPKSLAAAKRKLKPEVEENALVADYLKKVTPRIAREFQV